MVQRPCRSLCGVFRVVMGVCVLPGETLDYGAGAASAAASPWSWPRHSEPQVLRSRAEFTWNKPLLSASGSVGVLSAGARGSQRSCKGVGWEYTLCWPPGCPIVASAEEVSHPLELAS